MEDFELLKTWDVLRDFGFIIDSDVMADNEPGLSYDFGDFKLEALFALNLHFQRVVHCGGIWATQETIANVEFELPQKIESRELCAAYLADFLDQYAEDREFSPRRETPWLAWGRLHRDLLPWVLDAKKVAEYQEQRQARPQCNVDRRFLRLTLNMLGDRLGQISDREVVVVSFDGSVLAFDLGNDPIVTAATGNAWNGCFTTVAASLRDLPKRLRGDRVTVGIWESMLEIGDWRFSGSYSGEQVRDAESP